MARPRTSTLIHRDPVCEWAKPRFHSDPILRRHRFGPVVPMHQPSLIERLALKLARKLGRAA